ncbi:hypothetical protein B296_00050948, partial [Ensete ventricosum]
IFGAKIQSYPKNPGMGGSLADLGGLANTWVRVIYLSILGGSTVQSTQIPGYGRFNYADWHDSYTHLRQPSLSHDIKRSS